MLSKLFSIFSGKKDAVQSRTDVESSDNPLYEALCNELRARRFRSLPNGQKIDGYADADLYIHLVRNGHDAEIMIDEEEISVVVDEETEQPAERMMKLASFSTTEDLYQSIYAVIDELCGKDTSRHHESVL